MPDRIVKRLKEENIVAKNAVELEGYTKVSEASKLKGLTTNGIRTAIIDGNLPALKVGGKWYIHDEDLNNYTPPGKGNRSPRVRS